MSEPTAEDDGKPTSQQELCIPEKEAPKDPSCSSLKIFIVALSFACFSKTLCGTYMKSAITQIERRFDLSSSVVGLIDGSFEMGNLLFLAVVSHFGARLHRPKLIGMGCFLMAFGAALTGLPHFFMGRYKYDTVIQSSLNKTVSISPCQYPMVLNDYSNVHTQPSNNIGTACLQTIMLLGPMFGFLLGSMCAKLYVDIGFVSVGFLPSLKKLLCTPAYFLLLCGIVLKFNSFIGLLTFKAKYMEQQFGQSASRANFLIGVLILPVVAVGIFLGGLLMKRYKLSVVAGAQLSFITSFTAFLLLLLHFGTKCDNVPVAGLTVSYNGTPKISHDERSLMSPCNLDCSCSTSEWDPVCSDSGITYVSPCLAGCTTSTGQGKNTLCLNPVTSRGQQICVFGPVSTWASMYPEFYLLHGGICPQLLHQLSGHYSWIHDHYTIFVGLLAFCHFTKSLTSAYTKSTITQIERRFEIPSSTIGIIDGSFEMGSLLVITVSYFGGKFHRPKIIAAGVLLMGIGTLLMALPHFIMDRIVDPALKSLSMGIFLLVLRVFGAVPASIFFGALIDSTCLKWGQKKCGGSGACRIYDIEIFSCLIDDVS
ncbi:solute carrier organic anion transporter family member 1C1-like protein [Labeo rohita]|uniref:Solute carrier organic anion transporter family member 1C1-like protein n=1 Tax=Labeo rohita TaxID=84645 RepID=A0A498LHE8_LABRO|nr:solute carrier organic anion transporter family member 1C1-like protein [Labeo rohita]